MGCGASSPSASHAVPAKRDRRKSIGNERTQAQDDSLTPLETPSGEEKSLPQVIDECSHASPPFPNKQKRKLDESRKYSEPMITASPKSMDENCPEGWDWRGAPEITITFDAKKPIAAGEKDPKAVGFILDHQLCVSKVLASSQAETAGVGVGWKLRWVEVTGRDCTWSVPITKVSEVSKAFAECRSRRNKKIVAIFALDQISAAVRYPEDEVFKENEKDNLLA